MTDSAASAPFHCESHRALLPELRLTSSTDNPINAIIVPAARPVEHLRHAMRLAWHANSRLVVLCSRGTRAAEVSEMASRMPGLWWLAIDLPADYTHPWLKFDSTHHDQVADRTSDLSTKRNLGLLLARMAGWDRVLFLDDDIRGVTATQLARLASGLDTYAAAGVAITEFPDNSVVCHAHRDSGGRQDVFVGGSALAVRVCRITPFFPQVYNEDWLFLLDDVRRRAVAHAGAATQLRYNPYDSAIRAVSEEFGDVLAEGLMTLLHAEAAPRGADAGFWAGVLRRRERFLADVLHRTEHREPVAAAVRAAQERRTAISAGDCVSYVEAWQDDLDGWENVLRSLPTGLPVCQALRELELTSQGTGGDRTWARMEHWSSTPLRAWLPPLYLPVPTASFRKASGSATATPPGSAPGSRSDTSACLARA